ncbi:MAG: hypothetical protein LBF97_02465, partial [Elusimicrobiota bacterium]|nr:hypothetical protein [Elusimicrobiota bacterium]
MAKKLTQDEFIEKSKKVHDDKYDYSLIKYENAYSILKIKCNNCGNIFKQEARNHLRNKTCCPFCNLLNQRKTTQQFVYEAKKLHNDKYEYLDEYIASKEKIKIKCKKCGTIFLQSPHDHLRNEEPHGCPKCGFNVSKPEIEINDYIKNLGFETILSSKILTNPYEIDIIIPGKKIAIEYNGLYWHNEESLLKRFNGDLNLARNIHQIKYDMCKEKGYQLLNIWEDDFKLHKDIILNMLSYKLGVFNKDVYARKTSFSFINKNEAESFLNENHIQGFSSGTYYLGLKENNELVAVMVLLELKDKFILARYATSKSVKGGFTKLLKNFNPNKKIETF